MKKASLLIVFLIIAFPIIKYAQGASVLARDARLVITDANKTVVNARSEVPFLKFNLKSEFSPTTVTGITISNLIVDPSNNTKPVAPQISGFRLPLKQMEIRDEAGNLVAVSTQSNSNGDYVFTNLNYNLKENTVTPLHVEMTYVSTGKLLGSALRFSVTNVQYKKNSTETANVTSSISGPLLCHTNKGIVNRLNLVVMPASATGCKSGNLPGLKK